MQFLHILSKSPHQSITRWYIGTEKSGDRVSCKWGELSRGVNKSFKYFHRLCKTNLHTPWPYPTPHQWQPWRAPLYTPPLLPLQTRTHVGVAIPCTVGEDHQKIINQTFLFGLQTYYHIISSTHNNSTVLDSIIVLCFLLPAFCHSRLDQPYSQLYHSQLCTWYSQCIT